MFVLMYFVITNFGESCKQEFWSVLNTIFVRVFRLNFLEKKNKIIRTPFLFMSGRQLFSDALKVLEE